MSCAPGGEIPYMFEDESLRDEALAAASAFSKPEGNKRLALIGDAALRLVLYMHGYARGWSTEQMSDLQSKIVGTNDNLILVGFRRGLDRRIRPNPAQNCVERRLMATTMDAIIGAVYIDSGEDIVVTRQFIMDLGLLSGLPR
ncbi:RNAse III [Penicillium waksmanii]|uniref:RNAse III n=1 Tax=Penicillium waksmanii TaxID=69791 RepID=UPI002546D21C|nr:RNAse III [Penicillium waksmanii]KAJ5994966.1 RNAse III [Penicillium waksmanii]